MTGFVDFQDDWGKPPAPVVKCHESHPPLHIGGGTLLGGNCEKHHRHEWVDFYVALDRYMAHPVFDPDVPAPQCVYYPITNMKAPNRPDKFKALVDNIVARLSIGQTVHVGCIGGHGRTGLVLAAVVQSLNVPANDPGLSANDCIGWVRKHYCKKAVESVAQENFLIVNYGAKPQPKKQKVDKFFGGV